MMQDSCGSLSLNLSLYELMAITFRYWGSKISVSNSQRAPWEAVQHLFFTYMYFYGAENTRILGTHKLSAVSLGLYIEEPRCL